ncbi:MAG: hypothetical protein U0797_29380 [Gemmataceae bacterium]
MSLPSRLQWKSLAILSLTVLPAGCHRFLPPPPAPLHQGVTLRVSAPPSVAGLVRAQARAWAGRQEARVEVVEAPAEKPAEGADVWLMPPAELPRWASAGRLSAVPAGITERAGKFDWNGLLPLYREQLLGWDKKPFAVPLAGEAPVCVYRADLLASKEHQAKYRAWAAARKSPVAFRPPASWEEFATLAEYFRDHHPSGKPSPSLPPLPADERALDRLYYQIAASYARRAIRLDEEQPADPLAELFAFHYDLKAGAPRVATPGFVAALKLLARLQGCRPGGASDDPAKAFLDEAAVLAIADAPLLMEVQKRPTLRDKVGVASVRVRRLLHAVRGGTGPQGGQPRAVPGGGGWLAAVPSGQASRRRPGTCSPSWRARHVRRSRPWSPDSAAGRLRTDQALATAGTRSTSTSPLPGG